MPAKETIAELLARIFFSVVVATGIVLGALYIFNSLGDIKYLPASAMAFGVGFFFIHLIFKYWINIGVKRDSAWNQFKHFLILFFINVVINTEIVYLLVTYTDIPLLTAQTVAAVAIAYESYYAYLSLLYRNDHMRMVRKKKSADDIIYYNEKGERQDNL